MEEYKQWAQVSMPRYNHSFSKYKPNLIISASTVPEKTVTQIYFEKTEKWINEGKNKCNNIDFLYQYSTTHYPYAYQVSRLQLQ